MTTIQIYIPRILGTIKEKDVIEVFKTMEIGKVTNIDMKYKINENNNAYYYAFIDINLFSTIRSQNFKNSVIKFGMIRLLYDEMNAQYWEIKHHIQKKDRTNMKPIKDVPFYRFITLLHEYSTSSNIKLTNSNKIYNMWENSFDLIENRRQDLLC